MRPMLKFDKLQTLDHAGKLKSLHKQVALNLALPYLCLDMMGEKLAYLGPAANDNSAGVRNFSGIKAVAPEQKEFEALLRAKYATPDQNPNLTEAGRAVTSWFHNNMPDMDNGYLPLFDLVDMRSTGQPQFDIRTTSAGVTWTQRKPGEEIKVRREFAEGKVIVSFIEYVAGIGILDQWLQFNQFWNVSEILAEFMAQEAEKRAALHYGLFTALSSGINQAFDTDDAKTFNAGASALLRNVRTSGYAAGQNAQLDILCAPEHVGRILRMLDATRGSPLIAFGTLKEPIAFQVRNVIASTHVPSNSTGYYLVLPGRKIKRAVWMDPRVESKRDIYHSAEDWVGRAQYNAAIADSNQVRRVLLS